MKLHNNTWWSPGCCLKSFKALCILRSKGKKQCDILCVSNFWGLTFHSIKLEKKSGNPKKVKCIIYTEISFLCIKMMFLMKYYISECAFLLLACFSHWLDPFLSHSLFSFTSFFLLPFHFLFPPISLLYLVILLLLFHHVFSWFRLFLSLLPPPFSSTFSISLANLPPPPLIVNTYLIPL